MRRLRVSLLAAFLGLLTGCDLVSLHPLVLSTDQDAIFDPALVGTWEDVGDKSTYTVARAGSGYTVTLDPKEREGRFSMHLLKVGALRLLDIGAKSASCDGDSCGYTEMRPDVHLFFRLRVDKDSAWLSLMDSDWLKGQIKTRGNLRHEVLAEQHDRVVLTASPAELRRYLLPYVADDRAFAKEDELRRIK